MEASAAGLARQERHRRITGIEGNWRRRQGDRNEGSACEADGWGRKALGQWRTFGEEGPAVFGRGTGAAEGRRNDRHRLLLLTRRECASGEGDKGWCTRQDGQELKETRPWQGPSGLFPGEQRQKETRIEKNKRCRQTVLRGSRLGEGATGYIGKCTRITSEAKGEAGIGTVT